jgi:hypothetical protein
MRFGCYFYYFILAFFFCWKQMGVYWSLTRLLVLLVASLEQWRMIDFAGTFTASVTWRVSGRLVEISWFSCLFGRKLFSICFRQFYGLDLIFWNVDGILWSILGICNLLLFATRPVLARLVSETHTSQVGQAQQNPRRRTRSRAHSSLV